MAKKRITDDLPADDETPDEEQPVGYENVEPEAVEEPSIVETNSPDDGGSYKWLVKPGGPAVSLDTDERQYRVSFTLPYSTLVALLDPSHPDADTTRVITIDELKDKILGGFDQTAVRHKMNAAWREQHNREVDGK